MKWKPIKEANIETPVLLGAEMYGDSGPIAIAIIRYNYDQKRWGACVHYTESTSVRSCRFVDIIETIWPTHYTEIVMPTRENNGELK